MGGEVHGQKLPVEQLLEWIQVWRGHRSHIVVAIDVVDFQSRELIFELSDFFNVCVHCILVDVSFFIYLLDDE